MTGTNATPLTGARADLADRLFDCGAVKFGAFRLKLHETQPDAPLSPIYLNLRTSDNPKPGPLGGDELARVGELFRDAISEAGVTFTAVAGIPRAGDPLADATARAGATTVVLRLNKEENEGRRRIVAPSPDSAAGHTVVLIEDLITQADTKLEAVEAVRAAGGTVAAIIVLVDREQGGTERVRTAGYQVHAVYTLSELLEHYVATGRIDPAKAAEVSAYVAANR